MKNITRKLIIVNDKVKIFEDFTLNLLYYIYNYYIDYESLSDDVDIRNHYNWCFNKVCDEFKLEEIDFSDNNELREYFFTYYYHQFYKVINDKTLDTSIKYYENFWKKIFDMYNNKNKNRLNVLIELYNIFNISLSQKSEKNIINFV